MRAKNLESPVSLKQKKQFQAGICSLQCPCFRGVREGRSMSIRYVNTEAIRALGSENPCPWPNKKKPHGEVLETSGRRGNLAVKGNKK